MGDDGVSLIEVLVAGMLIAFMMAATSQFFLSSLKATEVMGSRQVAAQIATSANEQVRAVNGYQAGTLPPGGQARVSGVLFTWTRTINSCYQARMAASGTCTATAGAAVPVVFNKITTVVQWSDTGCGPTGSCTLTATVLVSAADNDPTFNRNG